MSLDDAAHCQTMLLAASRCCSLLDDGALAAAGAAVGHGGVLAVGRAHRGHGGRLQV